MLKTVINNFYLINFLNLNKKSKQILIILTVLFAVSCKKLDTKQNSINKEIKSNPIIYETDNLTIKKLSNHVYQHISFLNTETFGKVGCNGMLVINKNKGIVFDTPTDINSSLELIQFVTQELKCEIKAIIPTHFHEDCIGGIEAFEKYNIPTYASNLTETLLEKSGINPVKPINLFTNKLILNIGNKDVYVEYFGEGHTEDNVIGYFPKDNALFGGCLIKEIDASKGYLGDANTNKWSETVRKIKLKYPDIKIVIPGHGESGDIELLDYTIELFKIQ